MQCNELESVLEGEGLGSLPLEAQEHLADCTACQNLLADLSAIVVTARALPVEVQPPDRLWISVRAQLEAEGVIRQPAAIPDKAAWWQNLSDLFRPRNLATVGVALLLITGAILQTRKTGPSGVTTTATISTTATPQRMASTAASSNIPLPSPSEAGVTLQRAEQDLLNIQLAGNSTVDASLRQNLRTVDEFIAECELRLKQNPQDELAREYLYSAYEQKAELLAAMMDSGRSEH